MSANIIHKILIANRGEIARRIIRTCKKMGIETLALYTPDEKNAAWITESDEAFNLGEGNLSETYLNINKIIDVAQTYHCDAIHPGYGFLSENADFAKACRNNHIVFIGPSPDVIELMGNKLQARAFVNKLNIPLPFGISGTRNEILSNKDKIVLPAIIKASAGGGGKGMHIVRTFDELEEKLQKASHEAKQWFANGEVFIEQYFENARHIEVQVLSDQHGKHLHLFERECTLQRNYQKVIEEAPSPTLNSKQRNEITQAAIRITQAVNYTNAGTIEFLWENGKFYFLEMNTRIQVEHPVTEQITGIDLIEQQIKIAQNNAISFKQESLKIQGHAIEARIYAEQPNANFKPSAGFMHCYKEASQAAVRFDSTYNKPSEISTAYDGLITKVIAHKNKREQAIDALINAIDETNIHGIYNNGYFIKTLLDNSLVIENKIHTKFIDQHYNRLIKKSEQLTTPIVLFAAIIAFENQEQKNPKTIWQEVKNIEKIKQYKFSLNNELHEVIATLSDKDLTINKKGSLFNFYIKSLNNNSISLVINNENYVIYVSKGATNFWVQLNGEVFNIKSQHSLNYVAINKANLVNEQKDYFEIKSPLHGKISNVFISINQVVKQGEPVLSIESMKTDNQIVCPANGTVKNILIENNNTVKENQVLITFKN